MDEIQAIVKQIGDRPLTLARFANVLMAKGRHDQARALCQRALSMDPKNDEIRVILAEMFSMEVPSWYFPMVRDHARHRLYEDVLRKKIRPNDLVLDIGSGTGLFAMLAARLGALVVTCEARPLVADAVSDIVAKNGFTGRIKVLAKRSTDLEMGVDIDRPADVIVWDNLANNLLAAGALPATEVAINRFSHEGTHIIPARATIRASLGEDTQFALMGELEGFDVTPFNRFAPPRFVMSSRPGRVISRSQPTDVFNFDFRSGGPFPGTTTVAHLVSEGGRVNGIIQWARLELDEATTFENPPPLNPDSAMGALFHAFAATLDTREGEVITIGASHDREDLRIWRSDT
jgi:hypothetical protein